MSTYYHITKPEHVADICNEGLKPSNGENSQSINDGRRPRISLCSQKSIDAWCILLGADRVIRVNLPKDFPVTLIDDTEGSDEYSTNQPIPAKYISKKYKHTPSQEVLDSLRENYMGCLSYFCTMCARYYTPGSEWKNDPELTKELKENIKTYGECIIPVIPKLKYTEMTKEERCRILQCIGDSGTYSFCDEYVPGYNYAKPVKRLYQMLPLYEKDDLYNIRKTIYNLIKENFKYCLRINTGGWTG